MVTGFQDVYVNVANMATAVAFYRDVLGLVVTDEDPYFTGLSAGEVRIGLHWTGGAAVPSVPHDAHGPHTGATITFRVADLAAARQKLEATAAKILGSSNNPWGKILVLADPDGNILKLMQPPG